MQNHMRFAAFALAALLCQGTSAVAGCEVQSQPFFLHLQDLTQHSITTDTKGCDLNFATDGKTLFSKTSIIKPPKNGKLTKSSPLDFAYHPKPGFKGADAFVIKVCGTSQVGRGCSTLNYATVVN